jgi:hypothetical protein
MVDAQQVGGRWVTPRPDVGFTILPDRGAVVDEVVRAPVDSYGVARWTMDLTCC